MKKICLILEPNDFSKVAIQKLKYLFDVKFLNCLELSQKKNVEVIFCRLKIFLGRNYLNNFENLKFICSPTTGLNHIDITYCRNKSIKIISLKGERQFLSNHVTSTAEFSWALMLTMSKKVIEASNQVLSKIWERENLKSYQLKDKKLGIVGMGRIGKQIRKYANTFGFQIYFYDPFVKNLSGKIDNLEKLARMVDIMFICCELNLNTKNLINKKIISKFKKNVLLINTSRGEIIDEEAIIKAILSDKLYYATDVICDELNPAKFDKSKLLHLNQNSDRILITPHIGGASKDAMKITEEFISQKLNSYYKTKS